VTVLIQVSLVLLVGPLCGAGAALMLPGAAVRRVIGCALILVGMSPHLVDSTFFAMHVAREPFISDAPTIRLDTARLVVIHDVRIAPPFWRLRASPHGTHFSGIASGDSEEDDATETVIADFAGTTQTIRADALDFINEEQVLLAVRSGEEMELRQVAAGRPNDPLWSLSVKCPEDQRHLDLRVRDGRWHLICDGFSGTTVSLNGEIGGADVIERRWERRTDGIPTRFASHAPYCLELELELPDIEDESAWNRIARMARCFHHPASLWMLGPHTSMRLPRSSMRIGCFQPPPPSTTVLCSADDGRRTYLWGIDLADGVRSPLGVAERTWVRGWDGERLVGLAGDGLVEIEPQKGSGWRAPLEEEWRWSSEIALNPDGIVQSRFDGDGTRVRFVRAETAGREK
jgi:hypothetical protein